MDWAKKGVKYTRHGLAYQTLMPKSWAHTILASRTTYSIFARFLFNNEKQGAENIDAFVTRLKTKALDCNFAERDNTIRDRIVTWSASEKCREKLINEGDKLIMDKAIQIVQNFEYCQKQLSTMTLSGATGTSVDVIHDAAH